MLLTNGIHINGELYRFILHVITCDAPAKSFVKGVKQFNGKEGCNECHTLSKNINGSSIYIGTDFICRTDSEFRVQSSPAHHIRNSPFTDLDIDMIKIFNVDYMHCVLLGVTKKLLKTYLGKNHVIKCTYKLSKSDINKINDRLIKVTKCIPSFFVRKARTLEHIDRFKATELRQILLYTGKIVFKNILNRMIIINIS